MRPWRACCCHAFPCLISAAQVGSVGETEPLQRVGGEAGAVTLTADEHDATVVVVGDRQSIRAGRVQPPFEDVAVDHQGVRQVPVPPALIGRADVDDEGTSGPGGREVRGLDPIEPAPTLLEQTVDG